MKRTTKSAIKFRKTQEILTPEEIDAIRGLNLGYGKFLANARAVGIHRNTFRYILDRGYGTRPMVQKIKRKLLEYESSPY